jgi:hypothetical protein
VVALAYDDERTAEQRRIGFIAGDQVYLLPEDLTTIKIYRAPRKIEEQIIAKVKGIKESDSGRDEGEADRLEGADQI